MTRRDQQVLSVWRCELCRVQVAIQGHPRRQRHRMCQKFMTYVREIRPAPRPR